MTDGTTTEIGTIAWIDLTIPDAEAVRDFYSEVTGWDPQPVSMGEYDDFNMTSPDTGEPVAGICHARGVNAGQPSQWLIYISVADADAAAELCAERGGEVIVPPRDMGEYRFCVIRDPAGAVAGLISKQ